METVETKEWVKALAEEIHGKQWSPNLDFVTHLEAQQIAGKQGIPWGGQLAAEDAATLRAAMLAMYEGRRARATKRK